MCLNFSACRSLSTFGPQVVVFYNSGGQNKYIQTHWCANVTKLLRRIGRTQRLATAAQVNFGGVRLQIIASVTLVTVAD